MTNEEVVERSCGRRQRLIFVNRYYDPDISATSQLLTDLARLLARAGFDVHVVCSRQLYGDADARLPSFEQLANVNVHRVMTSRFGRASLVGRALDYLTFYGAAFFELLSLIRKGDVVVAETDPPLISTVAGVVTKTRGATLINWLQDLFPEVALELGELRLPRALKAIGLFARDWSLRSAAHNVVLGERMQRRLIERGIEPERIHIIENWSECAEPLAASDSKLRRRLGLKDKFIVAYSGNLGRAHDYMTIALAASRIAHDQEIVFLMIGGGARMSTLREWCVQNKCHNVLFHDYRPRAELNDSLAAADVHLVTLLPAMEGLIVPSKLYGILASARPVIFIGAPDGECARVIHESNCGMVIPVGDGRYLAESILALKHDRERCAVMGQHGYEVFRMRYTREHALTKWIALLQPGLSAVGNELAAEGR